MASTFSNSEKSEQNERRSKADSSANSMEMFGLQAPPGLTIRQSAVLQMQQTHGNAAVRRMLAQRAEGDKDAGTATAVAPADGGVPAGPDFTAPIESDSADTRSPSGSPGVTLLNAGPDGGTSTGTPDGGVADGGPSDAGSSGGGLSGGTSATTFPSYSEIVADSTIQTAVNNAWKETKAATTATGRREQGFWIQFDTTSKVFSTTATIIGPVVGPTQTGSVNINPKPADSGNKYTIGDFHTHTPTTFRKVDRGVGPSTADQSTNNSDNVAGVVYDYVESPSGAKSIPAGHPLNSAAQLYHSGPNRRT